MASRYYPKRDLTEFRLSWLYPLGLEIESIKGSRRLSTLTNLNLGIMKMKPLTRSRAHCKDDRIFSSRIIWRNLLSQAWRFLRRLTTFQSRSLLDHLMRKQKFPMRRSLWKKSNRHQDWITTKKRKILSKSLFKNQRNLKSTWCLRTKICRSFIINDIE